jgi:hypothetical protein
MCPGTTKTARNLYAINYLKNHSVTCKEFAGVWNNLDGNQKKEYKQRVKEAKKTSAESMPA